MGYDINIRVTHIDDEKKTIMFSAETTTFYMSYNWTASCETYWSVRKNLSSPTLLWGCTVLKDLTTAFAKLAESKIEAATPINYPNWSFGVKPDGECMDVEECLGVFRYHLEQFRNLINKNGGDHALLTVDNTDYPSIGELISLPGRAASYKVISLRARPAAAPTPPSSSSGSVDAGDSNHNTTFKPKGFMIDGERKFSVMRGNSSGQFNVETYEDAMQQYLSFLAQKDPRAQCWLKLAAHSLDVDPAVALALREVTKSVAFPLTLPYSFIK